MTGKIKNRVYKHDFSNYGTLYGDNRKGRCYFLEKLDYEFYEITF